MKILLVNPGINCVGRYSMTPMTPMGLLKIGAYFKEHGHDVKLVDGAFVPNYSLLKMPIKSCYPDAPFIDYRPCGSVKQYALEGMMKPVKYYGKPISLIKKEMIEAFDYPDQIWVGSHLTYYYETSWELVALAKELFPKSKVLLGGIYPTLCPEHASRSGADIVYEGEIEGLESYLPDYSLMPYECKVKVFKASEGCRVNPPCAFCSVVALSKKFRPLDVDSTINWVQEQFNQGTKNFIMWSSQLLDPPNVFKDFCRKMIATKMPEQGIKLAASEGIQPSLFTDEMASLMRQAGFDDINIPMEAIRKDRIKEYGKPSSLVHVERSINLAFKYGFRSIKAFIMMATPNQTPEEIIEAIVYCWKRHVRISLMPFTPVPKSEMFEEDKNFQERPLELLNPFLWPAAHEGLTCQDLERIGEIVNLGFDSWYIQYRNDSYIDSLFVKACIDYNLIQDRKYFLESIYDNSRETVPAENS